jgi:4-amino-4-deoxy-L-arabinose transferase-like glycosyltransferase
VATKLPHYVLPTYPAVFILCGAAGRWIQHRKLPHVHTHYASTLAWLIAMVFDLPLSMTIHGSGEFDEKVPRTPAFASSR